jgi:hypothetical protein
VSEKNEEMKKRRGKERERVVAEGDGAGSGAAPPPLLPTRRSAGVDGVPAETEATSPGRSRILT